jgi:hypothetical protein
MSRRFVKLQLQQVIAEAYPPFVRLGHNEGLLAPRISYIAYRMRSRRYGSESILQAAFLAIPGRRNKRGVQYRRSRSPQNGRGYAFATDVTSK